MKKGIGRILKGNDVKLEGRLQLATVPLGQKALPQAARLEKTIASPTVTILQRHPEFALLEITCRCGTKMCLRCEYPAGGEKTPASEKPAQAGAGMMAGQTAG